MMGDETLWAGPGRAASGGRDQAPASRTYLFGDLLALARLHWIRAMAAGLAGRGYADYRATDAVLLRLLRRRGSVTITRIGQQLGTTRQAARKLVDGLERRGYATEERDSGDTRAINVRLTSAGQTYAEAVVQVLERLNRELALRVSAADLAAADTVLRASLITEEALASAVRIAPPS
jgi:DNA-binding MarR family transcriptional regulator